MSSSMDSIVVGCVCLFIYVQGYHAMKLISALLFLQQHLFLLPCKYVLPPSATALHAALFIHPLQLST